MLAQTKNNPNKKTKKVDNNVIPLNVDIYLKHINFGMLGELNRKKLQSANKEELIGIVESLVLQVKKLTNEKFMAEKNRKPALEKSRTYGAKAKKDKANNFAIKFGPRIQKERDKGYSYQKIADMFTLEKIKSPYKNGSGLWHDTTIRNIYNRY
nr:hypothetical protein [Candidatus Woesearchaeota archaeon]